MKFVAYALAMLAAVAAFDIVADTLFRWPHGPSLPPDREDVLFLGKIWLMAVVGFWLPFAAIRRFLTRTNRINALSFAIVGAMLGGCATALVAFGLDRLFATTDASEIDIGFVATFAAAGIVSGGVAGVVCRWLEAKLTSREDLK